MDCRRDVYADGTIVVVNRSRVEAGPAAHGIETFYDALNRADCLVEETEYWSEIGRDVYVVVGTTEQRLVAQLLPGGGSNRLDPEGYQYRWSATDSGTALVVAGTDARGLMYALLELADRIEVNGISALADVKNEVRSPDNDVRGVDRFVGGPVDDGWFFDDDFWTYYLDRLARCRFNRFVLITGYDTGFMSPPYPYLVDVPGYPDVHLSDELTVGRDGHREQIRRIGALCRRRGIEFVFGIWKQRPLSDDGGEFVEGLPSSTDLADYCVSGLQTLLEACPEIDGIQLRVNFESGVTASDGYATAEAFWNRLVDAVAAASENRDDDVALDLRAKGMTDDMIDHALSTGLDLTVPTKFWCESTGLPYHTTQMRTRELDNLDDPNHSRRYGYADLLKEPRAYDVLYRLWVVGTNRIFVWGDPDYARRFSRACEFGRSIGFEVTAPLSLKRGHLGGRDEAWPLFDDPALRSYEYEDERYWAWYLLFGRLGYTQDEDPDVWKREFHQRFGAAAAAIERGYRAASKVLPLLTAAHLIRHAAPKNWAEIDTGGALFGDHNYNDEFLDRTYLTAEPSDPGLFYRIDEYVGDVHSDGVTGKYTPVQVAAWLGHLATETREAIVDAERTDHPDGSEYDSTLLDLRMLADLGEYHAHKTHAAIALGSYRETGAVSALREAHASAAAMRRTWATLAERGKGSYHEDLVFAGPAGDGGQWTDRLVELDADVGELERLLDAEGIAPLDRSATIDRPTHGPSPFPSFDFEVPDRHPAGEPLDVTLGVSPISDVETIRLHYRHSDQREGAFERIEMESDDGCYRATVPGAYLTSSWDLLVYVTIVDSERNVLVVPGLYHVTEPFPYCVVEIFDADASRDGTVAR